MDAIKPMCESPSSYFPENTCIKIRQQQVVGEFYRFELHTCLEPNIVFFIKGFEISNRNHVVPYYLCRK